MRCRVCNEKIPKGRYDLGYRLCLEHGDVVASKVVRCVVPMHKGHYFPVFDKADLVGINNKGGIVK
jgi:hypothetical protein